MAKEKTPKTDKEPTVYKGGDQCHPDKEPPK
jgi:hypothetical protein